jgi:hypothetical protein
MNAVMREKKSLVRTLIDEASDVDLVCYLARSGGETALKDLLECVRDAEGLSKEDLLHNISVVRQKKTEAYACPMYRVLRRLIRSDPMPVVSGMEDRAELGAAARLH